MRNKLSQLLVAATADPKVIVLTADHGYALFDELRKVRPDQFINMGICEQAMIGIAAGLAYCGYKPIVYGLACFLLKAYEQIRLDICVPQRGVMLIADGCGESYETYGVSHQCPEWSEMFGGVLKLDAWPIYTPDQLADWFPRLLNRGSTCLCIVPQKMTGI